MDCIRGGIEESGRRSGQAGFPAGKWRGIKSPFSVQATISRPTVSLKFFQSSTVETSLAALQDDSNASLPPLMNPAILEASDDLTNLSHLNEPAGSTVLASILEALLTLSSSPSHQVTLLAKGDIYI